MVLVVSVAALPAPLVATLLPGQGAGALALDEERDRLDQIRERIERRRALERTLHARIDRLDARLFELREQGTRQRDEVAGTEDEIRRIERELKRLAPRVLARKEDFTTRRRHAAHALADLAGLSRRVEIDPTIRSRLLAISPLMLQRLQSAETDFDRLRKRHEDALARYRALQQASPELRAGNADVAQERSVTVERRDAALEQHQRLTRELRELREAEQRLARRVLTAERAIAVRAEPASDEPAAFDGPAMARAPEATVARQQLAGRRTIEMASGAVSQSLAPSFVALKVDWSGPGSPAVRAGRVGWPPPPEKPVLSASTERVRLDSPLDAGLEREASFEVASLEGGFEADPEGEGLLQFSRRARPIVPSPASLLDPITASSGDRPVITMPARPGQPVAAPDAGRVVFADNFRSYGLLLILEHEREYHTILWGFSQLDVSTGNRVAAGDILGVMGTGDRRSPELHVEFRRNGRPVGLLPWLAASSSKVRG